MGASWDPGGTPQSSWSLAPPPQTSWQGEEEDGRREAGMVGGTALWKPGGTLAEPGMPGQLEGAQDWHWWQTQAQEAPWGQPGQGPQALGSWTWRVVGRRGQAPWDEEG